MDINVSPLEPQQAEAVEELARLIWRAHYLGIITAAQIEYMLGQRYAPEVIRASLAKGEWWDVSRDQDEPIEFADGIVAFAHSFLVSDSEIKVDKLYVHPDYQRRGLGRQLLATVAARAGQMGCRRLLLRVNRYNRQAIQAYTSFGFKVEGNVKEDIGAGFIMDDYLMVLPL